MAGPEKPMTGRKSAGWDIIENIKPPALPVELHYYRDKL
jgi:hypothetical protein